MGEGGITTSLTLRKIYARPKRVFGPQFISVAALLVPSSYSITYGEFVLPSPLENSVPGVSETASREPGVE